MARIRGGWRPDELRNQPNRCLSLGWQLRRSDSQRREACRTASNADNQVRVGDQFEDREGTRPRRTARPNGRCRRGNRMIRRREFISLLGGAAVPWPLAASAQQRERVRRIGMLNTFAAEDPEGQARIAALLQALQPLGWTVGTNLRIDHRWGTGDAATTRKNAAELVALAPDVILTSGAAGVGPLLETTRSVPVVFVLVADPVGAGFIDSMARPGRNATGFIAVEYGMGSKLLELLKEIAPRVTRAAVIRDPAISAGIGMF